MMRDEDMAHGGSRPGNVERRAAPGDLAGKALNDRSAGRIEHGHFGDVDHIGARMLAEAI